MKKVYIIISLLFFIQMLSQNRYREATIINQNNDKLTGKVLLKSKNLEKKLSLLRFKKDNKSQFKQFTANQVKSVQFENKKYISKSLVGLDSQFFEVIKEGKISILFANNQYYLDNLEYGLKNISYPPLDIKSKYSLKKGIISVYTNSCTEAHDYVYSKTNIDIRILKKVIDLYNHCNNYNDYLQPASEAINEANTPDDVINFYTGIAPQFINDSYDELSKYILYDLEDSNSIAFDLFVSADVLPYFLKNTSFFDFKFGLTFLNKNHFELENNVKIDKSHNFFTLSSGYNIFLLKSNHLSSYAGINGNLMLNVSSIKISDSTQGQMENENSHFEFNYGLELGANIILNKNKYKVSLEYIPKFNSPLIIPTEILNSSSGNTSDNLAGFPRIKSSLFKLNIGYQFF